MTNIVNKPPIRDRAELNFESVATDTFAFLNDFGFSKIESTPTLIRYQKPGVEVDVYHGRDSYEIGAGVSGRGARYSMSEIIRAMDPVYADQYRNPVATTSDDVAVGLVSLRSLMTRHGTEALNGNPQYFTALEEQRRSWSEQYALDVLVEQLRPKADQAFRQGDYATAAELFAQVRSRLSPAEIEKLILAEERRKKIRREGAIERIVQ